MTLYLVLKVVLIIIAIIAVFTVIGEVRKGRGKK